MSAQLVLPADWREVLEGFSRTHRGWLARVEQVAPGPTLESCSNWFPLHRVVRAGHTPAIRIDLQGAPSLSVDDPSALRIDTRDDGAERALEIERVDGSFVRLVFRTTARPEEVDGLAPAEFIDG